METGAILALVFGVIGAVGAVVNLIYTCSQSRWEERNRKAANKKELSEEYRCIVTDAHHRLQSFKNQEQDADELAYARRFTGYFKGNDIAQLNLDRKTVYYFWEELASQYNAGDLPADFFKNIWKFRARDYRAIVEPLDIANYYLRDLPATHNNRPQDWQRRHYVDHRPKSYQLVDKKLGAVRTRAGDQEVFKLVAGALADEWDFEWDKAHPKPVVQVVPAQGVQAQV